ncbi:Uncharacterized protein BCRIVMBC126_03191 [Bacillus wiedmannii]|nr:Uncharacterized protein BCRIVMBC126_03191 [Bacillus wiedmannii]
MKIKKFMSFLLQLLCYPVFLTDTTQNVAAQTSIEDISINQVLIN